MDITEWKENMALPQETLSFKSLEEKLEAPTSGCFQTSAGLLKDVEYELC